LHTLQQGFNELVQTVVQRKREKLSAQRLEYLKEREASLTQFLNRAEGQITGIEESITSPSARSPKKKQTFKSLTGQLEESARR
jgi:chromosome segregation protein